MGDVLVTFNGSYIDIKQNLCWQLRGESMSRLIKEAYSLINQEDVKKMFPFSKRFYLNDHGDGEYTIATDKYTDKTIPCFAFDHWKECRINNYTEVCEQISEKSIENFKIEKLLWIGQNSHPSREIFVKKYQNHSKIFTILLPEHWGHGHINNIPYISLPQHCKFKYLIDLQGFGYSARFKFLMHSRRPIFFQKRKYHEYWFWYLKPFVHYIPIEEDFSDFEEMFQWAENNQDKCKEIAENAFEFAQKNLKKENALIRLKNILIKLGTEELKSETNFDL